MPWNILGIKSTSDEREIRRAYARQLKTRQHEGDLDYFNELRQAYEWALEMARGQVQDPPPSLRTSLHNPENELDCNAASECATTGNEVVQETSENDITQTENASDQQDEISHVGKDVLEHLFLNVKGVFQKNRNKIPGSNECDDLNFIFTCICDNLQSASLTTLEEFSERFAVLCAENWPTCAQIWPQARDFFNWCDPVPSDTSLFADTLRFCFDEAEKSRLLLWETERQKRDEKWLELSQQKNKKQIHDALHDLVVVFRKVGALLVFSVICFVLAAVLPNETTLPPQKDTYLPSSVNQEQNKPEVTPKVTKGRVTTGARRILLPEVPSCPVECFTEKDKRVKCQIKALKGSECAIRDFSSHK